MGPRALSAAAAAGQVGAATPIVPANQITATATTSFFIFEIETISFRERCGNKIK